MYPCEKLIPMILEDEKLNLGAGTMAQKLRTLVLPEDAGPILSTDIELTIICTSC